MIRKSKECAMTSTLKKRAGSTLRYPKTGPRLLGLFPALPAKLEEACDGQLHTFLRQTPRDAPGFARVDGALKAKRSANLDPTIRTIRSMDRGSPASSASSFARANPRADGENSPVVDKL
jgi:hypothetical protein